MRTQNVGSLHDILSDKDAILLDYNGTLSNDEDVLYEIVAQIAHEDFGIILQSDRYYEELVGSTEEHIFTTFAIESSGAEPELDVIASLVQKFNGLYLSRVSNKSTIEIPSRQFVQRAKSLGKKVALVTAASRVIVEQPLIDADIHHLFDAIVCLEDVEFSKPKPDVYLKALSLMNVASTRGIAFEDSKTGWSAAQAADLTSVIVLGSLSEAEAVKLSSYTASMLTPCLFDPQ